MTDTNKHTPWSPNSTQIHDIHWVEDSRGENICDLYVKTHSEGLVQFDNAEANARLIAAAPELLEALEMWRDKLKGPGDVDMQQLLHQTDQVISKARGQS